MSPDPDHVAQCAQLAMLFELSSSPKPGNVDRCHDFREIGFHHFLASAVSAYPTFRAAACGERSIGSLLLQGVSAWRDWNVGSNTHFGSLVLLIPLAVAAGRMASCKLAKRTAGENTMLERPARMKMDLRESLSQVLRKTTTADAVDFCEAFAQAGARVTDVPEFDLLDPSFGEQLQHSGRTLRDLMLLSRDHDLVAREWSTDYERSFRVSDRLPELIHRHGLNDGIVRAYLGALSEAPDGLVQSKFGKELARAVSIRAGEALQDATLDAARLMDADLLAEDINPGSTADLVASSLFITLLNGLKF